MNYKDSSTTALPPDYLEFNQVIQSFNRAAHHYSAHAHLQKKIGEDLIQRLHYLTIKPLQIADIGCGSGHLLPLLQQFYPTAQIYGIDVAPQMLQIAQQTHPTAQFICAEATQLPVATHSIDLIISNLMLQWCNDIHAVFTEFVRVLKPEGTLLFSTFGPDTLQELRLSWAKVDNYNHINYFIDMHNIGDSLLQAGLRSPVMDTERLVLTYPDGMRLMRDLKMIGAHNVTVGRPQGLTGKGKLQAILAHYETFRTKQNLLPATYEVIYGYALGNYPVETELSIVSLENLHRL